MLPACGLGLVHQTQELSKNTAGDVLLRSTSSSDKLGEENQLWHRKQFLMVG